MKALSKKKQQNKEAAKKEKPKLIEKLENTRPKTKFGRFIADRGKLIMLILFVLICIMFFVMQGASVITIKHIHSINVDGVPICYLASEEDAESAVNSVVYKLMKDGTSFVALDTDGRLTIEKADNLEKSQIVKVTTAADIILKATDKSQDNPLKLKIASAVNKVTSYTPDPIYKKDDSMLAGESKVVKKGSKGSQKQSTTYITVNGKVVDKYESTLTIYKEGKPATIKKGTLGLPKGADWKTYDGDPVFKNGAELVTTSKKYMGAPYRYGGNSLTSGIDCVWFVKRMYAKYGVNIPLSHSQIHKFGTGVSLKNAQKGDIICYSKHVGIYIGDGKMIEANSKRGVSIGTVNKGRVVTVRRVVK